MADFALFGFFLAGLILGFTWGIMLCRAWMSRPSPSVPETRHAGLARYQDWKAGR